MTKDECIASFKYSVLQHSYKHKNIIGACRTFNLSRTVYYKWLKRFNQFGYLGLLQQKKTKPRTPNQVKTDTEQIIYNYLTAYPTHEPEE
ncbi:hypothetical protein ES705_22917 [subsurface metagenome]